MYNVYGLNIGLILIQIIFYDQQIILSLVLVYLPNTTEWGGFMAPAIYFGKKVAYIGQNNQAIKSKNIKFYKTFAFFHKKRFHHRQ